MTLLSANNSTNAGADLWVIPDFEHSRIAAKLDWYLNFQLTRSMNRTPKLLGEELLSLLRKCNLPEIHYNKATGKLLIHSSQLLPNRWVVQLSQTKGLEEWCQSIHASWLGLRKPSLRVFLPTGLSSGEFQKAWKQLESFDDFSAVVD